MPVIMQPVIKYVSLDGNRENAQSTMPKDTIQAVEAQDTSTVPEKKATIGEEKLRYSYRPIRGPARVDPSVDAETQGEGSDEAVALPEDIVPAIDTKKRYIARKRFASRASRMQPESGSVSRRRSRIVRPYTSRGFWRRESFVPKAKPQGGSTSIEETWSLLSDQQTSLEPAQARRPRRSDKRYIDGLVEDAEAFLVPKRHDSDQK